MISLINEFKDIMLYVVMETFYIIAPIRKMKRYTMVVW